MTVGAGSLFLPKWAINFANTRSDHATEQCVPYKLVQRLVQKSPQLVSNELMSGIIRVEVIGGDQARRNWIHGSGRALGSWQPTRCTNFWGVEKLPLSPHCCDIAPVMAGRFILTEFGAAAVGALTLDLPALRKPL